MLKPLGTLHSTPRPSPRVIQEALNLLSVLGGKKEAKQLLDKMLAVQDHNERLVGSARLVIQEATQRDGNVTGRETELQQRIEAADSGLVRRELQMSDREKAAREKLDEESGRLELWASDLAAKDVALTKQRETDAEFLREKEEILAAGTEDLSRREEELHLGVAALNDREEGIKKEEGRLSDTRSGLNSFREWLDVRDARLRGAMEDNYDG